MDASLGSREDPAATMVPHHGQAAQVAPDSDRELMQSFRALEEFRSSQSRRFFQARGRASREGLQGPEWSADLAPTQEQDEAGQLLGATAASEAVGSTYTPSFGGRPTRPAKLDAKPVQGFAAGAASDAGVVPDSLAFGGFEIPVRDFDGGEEDAVDRLLEERHLMGSSLVATTSMGESVVIPTMPCGRQLVFNCVTTWGDQSFLGLAGIEMFDNRGDPVVLKDVHRQVTADPPSINILQEYEHDPRTVDKLFDQVNLTRDDLHVWLAPFTPGRPHVITVDLERKTHLSMIRVWNYNKSRLHSSRGVKDLEVLLDGAPIFVGEIRRAPGFLTHPEQACEHILFTQDEGVLQMVEENDWLPAHLPSDSEDPEDDGEGSAGNLEQLLRQGPERPRTAAKTPPIRSSGSDGRPITCANTERQSAHGYHCRTVTLVLHSTWGDPFYIGLTALEVLDASLTPIPVSLGQIDASPRDLNDLEEVDDDPRTLDKLLDGVGCTVDERHMWLAPFHKSSSAPPAAAESRSERVAAAVEASLPRNLIRIDLGEVPREVTGFHMWNYNKTVEDTCRGVKEFSVYCDEKYVATFLCRKAPGHIRFDFKQVVLLRQPPCTDAKARHGMVQGVPPVAPRMPSRGRSLARSSTDRSLSRDGRRTASRERPISRGRMEVAAAAAASRPPIAADPLKVQQQYETPWHPCGFLFKLVLLSTWSDVHYIGLDGIELYGLDGRPLRPKRVHSNHGSVRNLPNMEHDIRTEDNLLHGAPGASGRMWLAPLKRTPPNSVELVFDEPTTISCMHIWNYSRTPSRGARDIEIYVDDLLVYQGILHQEDRPASAGSAGRGGGRRGEAVLFTTLPEVVARERPFVYLPSAEELVTFIDADEPERRGRLGGPGLPLERPMTALTR